MKLTVSLAQMDIVFGKPLENLAKVRQLAAEAAQRGSDWLVLPELWSTAYDLTNAADHATPISTGIFAEIAALGQQHNLHIIGSTLSTLATEKYGNTLTWHQPDGNIAATYSKLHLFRLMNEHQFLTAGEQPEIVQTEWGKVGLGICYDLRFPELFRHYALSGATMMILPAEWPHPRRMHWRTLLRARAIENQMFVIACNRVGKGGGNQFFGHSAIIDPWGETIIEGGEQEMLLTGEIDFGRLPATRAKIPIFTDRRPEIYKI